jgi:hypothetical protein
MTMFLRRRLPFVLTLALWTLSAAAADVDPIAVGTWELAVPNDRGVAQWFWTIEEDGRYRFRSEGPGAAPAHEGNVTFADGRWTQRAASGLPGWEDGGTYELRDGETFVVTGKLGTGLWRRALHPAPPTGPLLAPREGGGSGTPGDEQ